MKIVRPGDDADYSSYKSLFLAGPTYRDIPQGKRSWREDAIEYLASKNYRSVVYVPEPFPGEYKYQVEWEDRRLNDATSIVFWIPRDLETLPGFTTNVEFGEWMNRPEKEVVLGYPEGAPKMRYLHHKADKYGREVFHTLEETLDYAWCWSNT